MMGAVREAAGEVGPAPKSFSSPKACIEHLSRALVRRRRNIVRRPGASKSSRTISRRVDQRPPPARVRPLSEIRPLSSWKQ